MPITTNTTAKGIKKKLVINTDPNKKIEPMINHRTIDVRNLFLTFKKKPPLSMAFY